MMAKRKGLLGMSPRRLKSSKKMSANKAARSGYTAPKQRTGANAGSKAMAKATTKSRTGKKLSSFAKLKNAAKQKALNVKGAAKSASRKAKAAVKKNTSSTAKLRLKKKVSNTVTKKTANLSRRIGGMKNAFKLGFGAGKTGSNKGITTKTGAKTRANLTNKRSKLTKAGTAAALYGGLAAGKAVKKAFPRPSFISGGVKGAVSPVRKKVNALRSMNAVSIAQSRIKSAGKRAGKMSAKHRKAISDGLKKRFRGG